MEIEPAATRMSLLFLGVITLVVDLLVLLAGFVLLIKGADFLIDGAVAISRKFGVSELFIGLTIVAFGTSAPELAVSLQAALRGSGIAIGNVLGSNIANVALILGLTALISPIIVGRSTIKIELPFVIIISVASSMILLRNESGLTRYDGIVLLCFLTIYFENLYVMAKRDRGETLTKEDGTLSLLEKKQWLAWLATLGGIAAVVSGGDLVVKAGVNIARRFSVSDTLIGVTIVAIGTSLPELVTSVMAGYKKKGDLAVGNIVGSNIFNLLLILGLSSLIPSSLHADRPVNQDVFFMIGVVVLLTLFTARKHRLNRFPGLLMLVSYGAYIFISILKG